MQVKRSREDPWLAGTWLTPAALSLIFVSTGVGVIARHRDIASVLAAGMCVAVTWHVWRLWFRARRSGQSRGAAD